MISQEEMNALLEAARPKVIQSLQEEISKSITYDVLSGARKVISDHVTQWIIDNVIPEVTLQLIEHKEGLISIGAKIAESLTDEMVKAMTASISESLGKSWTRREILNKLFSN